MNPQCKFFNGEHCTHDQVVGGMCVLTSHIATKCGFKVEAKSSKKASKKKKK